MFEFQVISILVKIELEKRTEMIACPAVLFRRNTSCCIILVHFVVCVRMVVQTLVDRLTIGQPVSI